MRAWFISLELVWWILFESVHALRCFQTTQFRAFNALPLMLTHTTGTSPVSETWSSSLELVLVLLETVLPRDFKRFK